MVVGVFVRVVVVAVEMIDDPSFIISILFHLPSSFFLSSSTTTPDDDPEKPFACRRFFKNFFAALHFDFAPLHPPPLERKRPAKEVTSSATKEDISSPFS